MKTYIEQDKKYKDIERYAHEMDALNSKRLVEISNLVSALEHIQKIDRVRRAWEETTRPHLSEVDENGFVIVHGDLGIVAHNALVEYGKLK